MPELKFLMRFRCHESVIWHQFKNGVEEEQQIRRTVTAEIARAALVYPAILIGL